MHTMPCGGILGRRGLSGAVPSAMHEFATPKNSLTSPIARASSGKSHNRPKSPNIAERPSIPDATAASWSSARWELLLCQTNKHRLKPSPLCRLHSQISNCHTKKCLCCVVCWSAEPFPNSRMRTGRMPGSGVGCNSSSSFADEKQQQQHPNLIVYRKMEALITFVDLLIATKCLASSHCSQMLSADDGVPIKTVKSFLSK